MAAPHAFLDVLANAQIRDAYLAGRISIILSSDLETILWTNGTGAHFMGMRTVAETIGVDSGFDRLTRHQIEAGLKIGRPVRVSGMPQSASFLVTATNLAPLGDVVFLRSINGQTDEQGNVDLIAGLSDETTAAAVFDLDGQIIRAAPNFELDWFDHRELRLIITQANQERRVKKRLLQKNPSQAIGVLALNHEPAIFLLIAAKPEIPQEQQVAADQSFIFDPSALPLQFGWRTNEQGQFEEVSPELGQIVGAHYSDIVGKSFAQLASDWNMDGDGTLRTLFKSHNAWGGITVMWPVGDAASEALSHVNITFFALPVYSRAREFIGFRGFAVMEALRDAVGQEQQPAPAPSSNHGLSPQEYEAFSIIAHTLQANLQQQNAPEEPPIVNVAARLHSFSPSKTSFELALNMDFNPFIPRATTPESPVVDEAQLALLQPLPLGILIYRDENLLFANEYLLQLTGFSTEENFRQHEVLSLILRDWLPKNILQNQDGEAYPIKATMRAVTWADGQSASIISFLPQQPQQADHLSQELDTIRNQAIELSNLLNLVGDGVLIIDRQGIIHSLNEGTERIFRQPASAFTGQIFTHIFAPESHAALEEAFAHIRQAGHRPAQKEELIVIAHDGEGNRRLLQVHFAPMTIDEGYCLLLRDVSDLYDLLQQKKQLESQRINAPMVKAPPLLPQASHQMRNALTAIIGLSQLMLAEKYGPLNNDRYRAYLRDISSSSDQIIRLIQHLDGSGAKLSKGLKFNRQPLALAPILNEILAKTTPQANANRIIMRTSLSVDLSPILVDKKACRQMLMGLVKHALNATRTGGQIILSAQNVAPDGVLFRLRDNGAGLSASEIKAITQTDPDLDFAWAMWGAKEGGENNYATGRDNLSATTILALVKKLAEANGARFHLRSEAGQGTLIEIIFALA